MIQPSAPFPGPPGSALPTAGGGKSIASLCLGLFGLVASIANAAIGAYLGATGQLHYLR